MQFAVCSFASYEASLVLREPLRVVNESFDHSLMVNTSD